MTGFGNPAPEPASWKRSPSPARRFTGASVLLACPAVIESLTVIGGVTPGVKGPASIVMFKVWPVARTGWIDALMFSVHASAK